MVTSIVLGDTIVLPQTLSRLRHAHEYRASGHWKVKDRPAACIDRRPLDRWGGLE